MVKQTAAQHLASVRKRLEDGNLSEQEIEDLAVIAFYYHLHAKSAEDRVEGAVLYEWAVVRPTLREVAVTGMEAAQ